MFKEHGGEDLISQLEFMAAQGFTALEDNGLMSRSVQLQESIGDTLARLGMTMGVFVINGGDNWKTSTDSQSDKWPSASSKVDDINSLCRRLTMLALY